MATRRQLLGSAAVIIAGASGLMPRAVLAQKRGGALNAILNPEPPILVLGLNQQAPTQLVAGKIYQGLLRYDFDLKPLPSLAKSWTVSPDGLTYTFKLEEGVKWHDGQPFTAEDVVFTTTKFLPEVHPRARAAFDRCESITAPDKFTVAFKLKEPFEPFLYAFLPAGAPMMPKHIYEGSDFRANPKNATPIGTGPFKFKEWVKGNYIHLVRNDEYLEARPPLPRRDLLPRDPGRGLARAGHRDRAGGPGPGQRRGSLRRAAAGQPARRGTAEARLRDGLADLVA